MRRADRPKSSADTRPGPTEQGGTRTKTGQLAAFTHLMDDANVVPGTERSRYPW